MATAAAQTNLILSDAQFIQKFFPRKGLRWTDFANGATKSPPADLAGVYVFSTYDSALKSNVRTWGKGALGGPEDVPTHETFAGASGSRTVINPKTQKMSQVALSPRVARAKAAELWLVDEIYGAQNPVETVIYAGRSTSRSLADRLGDYRYRDASRCKGAIIHLIETRPDDLYIRWTDAFHWETTLINDFAPRYNTRQTGSGIKMGNSTFDWCGKKRWDQYKSKLGTIPTGPGLYAFTTALGNTAFTSGAQHVLYIGEAGNLRDRMATYAKGKASNAAATNFVTQCLPSHDPKDLYLRWVENFIFENEVIRILKPVLNTASTSFD